MAGGKVSILVDADFSKFPGQLRAGLSRSTGVAGVAGRAIGTAIAGGTALAAVGFKKALDIGIEFQNSMNTLQAVTGATAAQMKQVGSTAQALGSDLSLPATSAADAAAAMTELAKGGLSVDQAMTAAKGSLQLAAAAQIDAASAAEIQVNALNAFNLSADQAGRVADVLANTANAATGEITDIAQALKAVGPVANQFGISIEDTATTLGIFANAGIQGSDAGTLMKSTLLALASPSKQAAKAMQQLGVDAFDAQGKFVGMPVLLDQLTAASKRMTPEQYAAAASIAFGSDAARTAGIAAGLSAGDWDKMSASVGKAGGAADVAGAKSKGLGGAIEGLKSQLETIAIDGFNKISPALEKFVRDGAEGLPKLATGAGKLFEKLKPVGEGFKSVFEALKPIATGIGEIVTSGSGLGPVGAAATVFGGALKVAAAIITPFAAAAGGLLRIFAALPGPIQSVVSALLLLKVGPSLLAGLFGGLRKTSTEAGGAARQMGLFGRTMSTVTSPVGKVVSGLTTGGRAVRAFGQEMKLQQSLARASGVEIGKLGAAQAAFATSGNRAVTSLRGFAATVQQIKAGAAGAGTPISTLAASMRALGEQSGTLSKVGQAFTTAAAGATRFKTTAGVVAAAGAGVRAGLGGLTTFLGGPWGVAFALAGTALAVFGAKQQDAAAKAQAHQQALEGLRGTLDTFTGAATEATVAAKQQQLAQDGTLKTVDSLGISVRRYTEASTGNVEAIKEVGGQLSNLTKANIEASDSYERNIPQLQRMGVTLDDLTQAALGNPEAINKVTTAIDEAGGTMEGTLEVTNDFMQSLTAAAGPAGELGRKLGISAVDMKRLAEEQRLATKGTKDFATSLEAIKPGLATLKDGAAPVGQVKTALDELGKSALNAATSAGKSSAALLGNAAGAEAARAKMTELRTQFVEIATPILGSAEAANKLADQIGLIPSDVAMNFQTNAPQVSAQLSAIVADFNKVPGTKTIQIDAPTAAVQTQLKALGFTVEAIPNSKQVKVSVDDAAAKAKATGLQQLLNGITALMKVDANIAPGTAKGQQLKTLIDNITGIITVDGNPAPGTEKANKLKTYVDGLIGILTEDGNNDPGRQKADELKSYTDGLTGQVKIDADASAAYATADQLVSDIGSMSASISVTAKTFNAAGNILPAQAYAAGGIAGARRMRANYANIVPPRMLRVIGDRARDDEAYIPINKSRRSRKLLEITASRMGYDLFRRFDQGGFFSTGGGRDVALDRLFNELSALQVIGRGPVATTATSRAGNVNVTQIISPRNEVNTSTLARTSVRKIRAAKFAGGL